jgi:hypothetical protein
VVAATATDRCIVADVLGAEWTTHGVGIFYGLATLKVNVKEPDRPSLSLISARIV